MQCRRSVLAAFVAGAVAGCGFELKRSPELRFRTVQLVGFTARSPLAVELRSSIDASTTTRVVDSVAQARSCSRPLPIRARKSSSRRPAAGQVTEFQLRARFRFRLRTIGGRELIRRPRSCRAAT
jgi:LPS-assembly lipoprotein